MAGDFSFPSGAFSGFGVSAAAGLSSFSFFLCRRLVRTSFLLSLQSLFFRFVSGQRTSFIHSRFTRWSSHFFNLLQNCSTRDQVDTSSSTFSIVTVASMISVNFVRRGFFSLINSRELRGRLQKDLKPPSRILKRNVLRRLCSEASLLKSPLKKFQIPGPSSLNFSSTSSQPLSQVSLKRNGPPFPTPFREGWLRLPSTLRFC